jgi:fructose-1,6-bisphosphatase/inositol monophosphatase family enzyme
MVILSPMKRDLERIAERVMKAVRALPEGFNRGTEVRQGADGTPTTSIDKVAEDEILSCVTEMDLPLNVLSEEVGFVDRGMEETLVIDPIDGTNNAVMGLPFFSVSLALGRRSMSDVRMGLVRNLITGETYFAEKGKGAYKDGERLRVREYDPDCLLFLIYMGRYASEKTIKVIRRAERARSLGCASLEMCLVAEGMMDAYYMNCERYDKSIRVVDIAASALILREAGGELLDLKGDRLDLPFDLVPRSNFAAIGSPKVAEVILRNSD